MRASSGFFFFSSRVPDAIGLSTGGERCAKTYDGDFVTRDKSMGSQLHLDGILRRFCDRIVRFRHFTVVISPTLAPWKLILNAAIARFEPLL